MPEQTIFLYVDLDTEGSARYDIAVAHEWSDGEFGGIEQRDDPVNKIYISGSSDFDGYQQDDPDFHGWEISSYARPPRNPAGLPPSTCPRIRPVMVKMSKEITILIGLTVVGCTVHSDKTPTPPPPGAVDANAADNATPAVTAEAPANSMAADWAWLQRTEAELAGKRERLKRLDGTPEAEALLEEVIRLGDEFGARLVRFINGQEIQAGDELTPRQRAAFDMKAAEDIHAAQGYIDQGGDYARAISIYTSSLVVDPGNERGKNPAKPEPQAPDQAAR